MYSGSNRKQPCRFFLQGKCNRGNSCKWPHELASGVNNANFTFPTNLNAPPTSNPTSNLVSSHEVPSRATDNAINRGGGSRVRYRRAHPTTKEKGKGPAHATPFGSQSNEKQGTDYSNSGISSAAPSRLGNQGRSATCPVILGEGRDRHEAIRSGSIGIKHKTDAGVRVGNAVDTRKNTDAAAQVGDEVGTPKKSSWNVNNSQPAPPPPEPTAKIQELPTTLEKVLAGCMSVRVGPGFSIQSITQISVPSSSIVIENVLPGTPIDAIQALVKPFKPSISPHAIRVNPRGNSLRVIVHFDDTVAADEAVRALELAEFHGRTLAVKALKPTAASQDVTQIECSWIPASATAVLHMHTREMAQEMVRSCCPGPTGVPKVIRGRRVRATLNLAKRAGWLSIFPTVTLRNLDPMTTEEDIRVHFDDGIVNIDLRKPKYQMSDFLTLRYIRQKFRIDSEEDLRVISGPSDSRTRAVMTYPSAADAIAAFAKVQGENDETFANMNFMYNLTYSVSFNIPCDIWKVVKGEVRRLDAIEQERKAQTRGLAGGSNAKVNPGDEEALARIKILDKWGGPAPIIVHVNGGGRPAVARIKVAIQKLLRGRIICDEDGKPLWDPALRGPEGRRLVQLVMESDVHVHVDYRNRTVTMYGSPKLVDAAETILKEQYRLLLTMQHELSLGGYQGRLAFRGGIAAVKEYLGEDMVIVNHAARKIYVRCSPADVSQVRNLLYRPRPTRATAEAPPGPGPDATRGDDACPVCMEPAEPPLVQTSCGHTYCKPCITGFIKATVDGRKFPISCFHTLDGGTGSACETPLSISIIQDVLSKADSDQLLEISFSAHVQARPNEYAYCPTPDCPTVYAVTTAENVYTCNQCLLSICTACKTAAHHGQTCTQYKSSIADQSQFEEWKRRAGVKTCPKCNADIEKNDGCNHITCKCGAHLCWHCMQEFPREVIYRHMSEACGGTYATAVVPENPAPPPRDPLEAFARMLRLAGADFRPDEGGAAEGEAIPRQRDLEEELQQFHRIHAQREELQRRQQVARQREVERQREIERQRELDRNREQQQRLMEQVVRQRELAQQMQMIRRYEAEEEEMRRRQNDAAKKSKSRGFCVIM
ncbi:hypothetical protein EV426DRAFT_555249 [Tirmania nivea]|nr:hypothetical protein EV426DRAFT_555249 [Tirmania nivea]